MRYWCMPGQPWQGCIVFWVFLFFNVWFFLKKWLRHCVCVLPVLMFFWGDKLRKIIHSVNRVLQNGNVAWCTLAAICSTNTDQPLVWKKYFRIFLPFDTNARICLSQQNWGTSHSKNSTVHHQQCQIGVCSQFGIERPIPDSLYAISTRKASSFDPRQPHQPDERLEESGQSCFGFFCWVNNDGIAGKDLVGSHWRMSVMEQPTYQCFIFCHHFSQIVKWRGPQMILYTWYQHLLFGRVQHTARICNQWRSLQFAPTFMFICNLLWTICCFLCTTILCSIMHAVGSRLQWTWCFS